MKFRQNVPSHITRDVINIPSMGYSLKNHAIGIKLIEILFVIAGRISVTSHHKIPRVQP